MGKFRPESSPPSLNAVCTEARYEKRALCIVDTEGRGLSEPVLMTLLLGSRQWLRAAEVYSSRQECAKARHVGMHYTGVGTVESPEGREILRCNSRKIGPESNSKVAKAGVPSRISASGQDSVC